jgi:hypothetical protein
MPIYRKIARIVRSQPVLWRALHPTHDYMTQRLRELRVWREYSGRMNASAFRGNLLIRDAIHAANPAAIGKIGSLESEVLTTYAARPAGGAGIYSPELCEQLFVNVGFFPTLVPAIDKFCETFLSAVEAMDILAAWGPPGEPALIRRHASGAKLVQYNALEPYRFAEPWSAALEGKRVLVIHPFNETIEKQLALRDKIWMGRPVLPKFELTTLKMPLSPALLRSAFNSWFDLLEHLKGRIIQTSFDVALIGAGGMSLPLAHFVKSIGRIGIHTGGSTQLLFGIMGRRWEAHCHRDLRQHFNEHWARPSGEEAPAASTKIEQGCYW